MWLTTLAILMLLTLGFPYFAVWTVWGESLPQVAAIEIDLLEAQMNGKHIADLTLDSITDWLGRPSAIKDNEAFGIDVYYHERGLVFNVVHQKYDEQQHCSEIHIYLSRSWDNIFSKVFLPYTGVISKNLDSNWKVDRLKSEFLRIRITDYDDDRTIKNMLSLKDILGRDADKYRHIFTQSRIDMETENSRIIVVDEPHTKFLEWISVSASKAKEKKDPEQESSPLSATPPKPSWNEPDGFQGLKFGQDLRKTVRACPQNWDGKSRCYFKLSKRAELPGDHYVLYNFGLIGGVWILTQAIQIQNKLVSISLYFQSHDFERLLAIFIARYRTPTHPDEKEVTNALGTRFRDRSA